MDNPYSQATGEDKKLYDVYKSGYQAALKKVGELYRDSECRRIVNANGARDKDIDAFYCGCSSVCKELEALTKGDKPDG